MPGEAPNINTKAAVQNHFDAIVVGSGISGGWAAKELCEKGLKVLLLDRGEPVVHPNYPNATWDPWQYKHRLRLSPEDRNQFPIQSRHWSLKEDSKHFYINDLENTYQESKRFDWIRSGVFGGRSLLWSRACYRWSDLDFEANSKDGHGIDWPIRYKDIAPWYSYVEKFVGISGTVDNIPQLPDSICLPPFEMNKVELDFKQRIAGTYTDRQIIIGRTANATSPVQGNHQCQARDLCHRGCPFGGYFSTNARTIPAAQATGNLTIKTNSLVNRVLYDEQKERASGVEVLDTKTKQTIEYTAKVIFLNAATAATTFILLNSVSNRFPTGLGNGSDQVGRNLMDHHKGISANAEVEGFEAWYYNGRRPTALYVPRFRNVKQQDTDFLRGYHFGASAYRGRGIPSDTIGTELKEAMSVPGSWGIGVYGFGECLPYEDNRITLSKTEKDSFGRPQLVFDCEFKDNEKKMNKDMAEQAGAMLEKAGYKNVRISNNMSFPGNANHEMGTARMGKDPKKSVLNAFNQMHEVKNLFITDGSCMTSGSCVNPSLTYMALTARAVDYAVTELKKGSI